MVDSQEMEDLNEEQSKFQSIVELGCLRRIESHKVRVGAFLFYGRHIGIIVNLILMIQILL